MQHVTGITTSNGIAIGKAFLYEEPDLRFIEKEIENVDSELERLDKAIDESIKELEQLKRRTEEKLGKEQAEIFSAHLLMLRDPELIEVIKTKIKNETVNAETALDETTKMYIQMFESMDNEYMRERSADIYDLRKRIMAHLLGVSLPNPTLIEEEVIVIAHDLTPSDTAQLNKTFVKGFVTNIGGRTSHSAIMARSLEIPAIVGTDRITKSVSNGDMMIIDGFEGNVIINPSDDTLKIYER